MTDEAHFERFMRQRELAARAYVRGEVAPLKQLAASALPATFFGPNGGRVEGAQAVVATYARDATAFEAGGETSFEILHMAASGGVGYWVGFQHARAHLRGKPEPVTMVLRVTEIFRREGDDWKLVHRHADTRATAAESG